MGTLAIEVNGVRLAALEAGRGGRPLLLVHGFTGAKEDFADVLDDLAARGWHAVAPDLRGHGESDKPSGPHAYSLSVFARDVIAVADQLAWSRFTLLGHSMGGMVVQLVAIDHAERLDALILMDTSHAAPDGLPPEIVELGKAVVSEGGMAALISTSATLEEPGPLDTPAFQRLVETKPGYREFCDAKSLACSPEMWLALVDELIDQEDRLHRLAELGVPTLVIVGDQDKPFLGHAERMAAAIPGARLAVIPDAGHSPQFEAPDAWWAALTSFLDEVAEEAA